uniref:Cysteine-rich protein n=1 Tax=Hyaloperonospora arabidopsidis TaxID=272952 RepID=F6MEZ0_HYAAB|nr:cysteine-rich protein [Hyaloperonospora arabidopsidis]
MRFHGFLFVFIAAVGETFVSAQREESKCICPPPYGSGGVDSGYTSRCTNDVISGGDFDHCCTECCRSNICPPPR